MVVRLLQGDCRERLAELPDASVQCCITSPPYFGLRDYGVDGQIGLERSVEAYVAELVSVFRDVRRVLRDDGTLWLNLGDSYNAAGRVGHGTRIGTKQGTNRASANGSDHTRATSAALKGKDLLGIPWRVAFALQSDGWYLRSDVIWAKPNPMPESVTDRPTKSHEYVFLMSKRPKYFFDAEAVKEPALGTELFHGDYGKPGVLRPTASRNGRHDKQSGYGRRHAGFNERWKSSDEPPPTTRNIRSVWTIATHPYAEAHFATFPPELAERCVKAGSREGDTVLDPFAGAGTVSLVAERLGRDSIGIELNPEYVRMAEKRIRGDCPMFTAVEVS